MPRNGVYAAIASIALIASGCGLSTSSPQASSTSTTAKSTPFVGTQNISRAATAKIQQVNGVGWDPTNGIEGSVPSSCHAIGGDVAMALPDPKCTPGAIDTQVTQANIYSTICRYGYTKTVRPPVSISESFKSQIMSAYGYSDSMSKYELDHLIPLELGGASTAANLWPELNNHPSSYYLNSKDMAENELHVEVCSGKITLAQAQYEIATDWTRVLV